MKILELDCADGSLAVAIKLPMKPYGVKFVCANDDSDDSEKLLVELSKAWPQLWPKMRTRVRDMAKELDLDTLVDKESLIGRTSRLTKKLFMGDRCDIYLSLVSDDHPDWDFFLKKGKIVHFQPVF